MNTENKNESKDSYHWILYHLTAMNYSKTKFDTKMSKIPSGHNLTKLESKNLIKIISELRSVISWYQNSIEYHQQKALSHIPETEKTKLIKEMRDAENKSYEEIFITANKLENRRTLNNEFMSGNELG